LIHQLLLLLLLLLQPVCLLGTGGFGEVHLCRQSPQHALPTN
jgi:hypothetical protein